MVIQLQIASDLHIDYKTNMYKNPTEYITKTSDILVLCGDIGSLYKIEQLEDFLKRCCDMYKIVIYVLGNHEFYKPKGYRTLTMEELKYRIRAIGDCIPNLHVLDRNHLIIGEYCFVGCTLWTKTEKMLPSFMRIYRMNKDLYNRLHTGDVDYIKRMKIHCLKKGLKMVMITHHLPTIKLMPEQKTRSYRYSYLYYSDLDELFTDPIDYWIYGHIHCNTEIEINGVQFKCNQLGKPKDDITDYNKEYLIELE